MKVTLTTTRIYPGLTHGLILQHPEESCENCQSGAHGICREYGHRGNFPCRCFSAGHPKLGFPLGWCSDYSEKRILLFGTDASYLALYAMFHRCNIYCDGDPYCPAWPDG